MNTKNDNSKFQYEALDEEIDFADILYDTSKLDSVQQLQLFKPQPSTLESVSETISRVERAIPILVPCPAKYNRPVVITTCHKCRYFSNQNANTAVVCSFQPGENERIVHPKNKLNELAGNEWMYFTKSVLRTSYPTEYGHNLRKKHGANKPPQLMKHIIEFFTKTGETVLDPFAGVGGTLLGASLCNRIATGIELNKEWIDIYHQVCEQENIPCQEMIHGDCLDVLGEMKASGQVYDFIATDPPYSIALPKTMCDGTYDTQNRKTDFESFSDSEDDLRNLESFEEYYQKMQEVFSLLFDVLKADKYLTMIIRDSYQKGRYIPASYELARRAEEVGFIFKGVKIWYQTGVRMRPYGYPAAYVPNIIHQNILILRKGDK
ncbi:site-specific DNA-methyltransferase [Candidatus Poribacteria bacterium]|nr:site-specific DNA-methyltransferase [Candidatus Poribacteria bacterium]